VQEPRFEDQFYKIMAAECWRSLHICVCLQLQSIWLAMFPL